MCAATISALVRFPDGKPASGASVNLLNRNAYSSAAKNWKSKHLDCMIYLWGTPEDCDQWVCEKDGFDSNKDKDEFCFRFFNELGFLPLPSFFTCSLTRCDSIHSTSIWYSERKIGMALPRPLDLQYSSTHDLCRSKGGRFTFLPFFIPCGLCPLTYS